MSDYDSSLPVRSESDVDERLQSKIVDSQDPTKQMEVDQDSDDGIFKARVKSHLNDHTGTPYTEANPLPTYLAENPGQEIDEFQQDDAVAKNASEDHDYEVSAGKVLKNTVAYASGSGKARFEFQIETAAASDVFETAMVLFNSTSNPNVRFTYKKPIPAGVKFRIVKANLDNQPQNLYSQIQGIEV